MRVGEFPRTPRAIAMLLRLKMNAIDEKDNYDWNHILGCGPLAAAQLVDCLIDDYNRTRTLLANVENDRNIYRRECHEWGNVGFDLMPSEYSPERQEELKALAARWKKEDEAE